MDFLENSSKVKPAKARKFEELITDSIENALRNTYAAAPEIKPFRAISNGIVRTGLTALPFAAFPRFFFSSLELVAKYSGGILAVPLRRILTEKKLNFKIRCCRQRPNN